MGSGGARTVGLPKSSVVALVEMRSFRTQTDTGPATAASSWKVLMSTPAARPGRGGRGQRRRAGSFSAPRTVTSRSPRRSGAGWPGHEPRFHRPHRAAEHLGHLHLGQSFHVEEDDGPCLLAEAHQRLMDLVGHDVPKPMQLDVVAQPPFVGCHLVGIDRVEAAHDRIATSATRRADERFPQDSKEPRLEVRPRSEPRGGSKRVGVGFLDEILGIRPVGRIDRRQVRSSPEEVVDD